MSVLDDRENRVPIHGLDGEKIGAEHFLRIRRAVRDSDAHTNAEIDGLIHRELQALQDRKTALLKA